MRWQHLEGLLLNSQMRNLANDVSQGWDLLTVKGISNVGQFIIPLYTQQNNIIYNDAQQNDTLKNDAQKNEALKIAADDRGQNDRHQNDT